MEPWLVSTIIISSVLLLLFTGLPVAFSLTGISAILLFLFEGPSSMFMLSAATFKQVQTEVYIAIPLFVLMAAILQYSGIAESLYRVMHMWMGSLRGGLAIGTILISTLIGALSGIGATATTTLGMIALPEMRNRGYNKHMAVGAITVGGALGQIIPPSVLMIIVGGYAQLSVGKLFMGGVFSGLLIALGYSLYIAIRCHLRPQDGPSMPKEEQGSIQDKIIELRYIILPVALIVFIMYVIYSGICTPTEAAGFGALGSFLIGLLYRQLTTGKIFDSLQLSLKVVCMIMWLLIGGGCFSTLVTLSGTGDLVLNVISNLPFGPMGLVVVMLCISLIMGMFIDPVAICMICVPIFMPVVKVIGVDPLWFVLLFVISVVIGYITPPFGVNIFYMKGIAPPDVTLMDIYKGTMPYALIKIFCLILCIIFPAILTFLPSLIK